MSDWHGNNPHRYAYVPNPGWERTAGSGQAYPLPDVNYARFDPYAPTAPIRDSDRSGRAYPSPDSGNARYDPYAPEATNYSYGPTRSGYAYPGTDTGNASYDPHAAENPGARGPSGPTAPVPPVSPPLYKSYPSHDGTKYSPMDGPANQMPNVGYRNRGSAYQPMRSTRRYSAWLAGALLLSVCTAVYLALSVRLFILQPLSPSDGFADGRTSRQVGIQLGQASVVTRSALNAAITIPTSILAWMVRRAHLLCSRQSSSGQLEPNLWLSHVAWSHPINYVTSVILLLLITVTQAAAASVIVLYLKTSPTISTLLIYSPLGMILHSSGLFCLSLWACATTRTMHQSMGNQLHEQFPYVIGQQGAGGFDTKSFDYPLPVRGRVRTIFTRTNLAWALISGIVPLVFFAWHSLRVLPVFFTFGSPWQAFTIATYFGWFPRSLGIEPYAAYCKALFLMVPVLLSVELFLQNGEAVVTRLYWQKLWTLRATGVVRPETVVEGPGAVRSRPHLVWLSITSAVESWAIASTITIDGDVVRQLIKSPVLDVVDVLGIVELKYFSGYATVSAILILLHLIALTITACLYKRSGDGLDNFGNKAQWIDSGISGAQRDDTWGAIVLPSSTGPGRLGWGSQVVSPPPSGVYAFPVK